MKTPVTLLAFALATMPTIAHADTEQNNQMMFGAVVSYLPAQNNLRVGDLLAVGHYVSYLHELDNLYFGARLTASYAWFPNGASGQQFAIEPAAFIGGRAPLGKRMALRFELSTGPLFNGGEGFAFGVINDTSVRVAFQAMIVKTFTLEIFAGPSFLLGEFKAAVMPAAGIGGGWRF